MLSVEGLRQLATYWSFVESRRHLMRVWANGWELKGPNSAALWAASLGMMDEFFAYLYKDGTSTSVVKFYDHIQSLEKMLNGTNPTTWNTTQANANEMLTFYASRGHAEFYGIKIKKIEKGVTVDSKDFNAEIPIEKLYALVFEYFFFAVGAVLVMYGLMGLFVRRKKDAWDYASVGVRFAAGLCIFAIERIQRSQNRYDMFINSPWPILTVCFILFTSKIPRNARSSARC